MTAQRLFALAVLACATGAAFAPNPGPVRASWKSPQAQSGRRLVYVSTFAAGTVEIFSQHGENQAPIGELTGLQHPQGLAVDGKRNLYVANTGAFNVLVYAPGATAPSRVIDTSAYGYPGALFVATDGTLYVGISQTTAGGQGMVLVFPQARATLPQVILDPVNSYHLVGIVADAQADAFVSFVQDDGRGLSVADYAPGSTQGKVLPLTTNFAGGLVFDGSGNLDVIDQGGVGAAGISVYAPGKYRKALFAYGGGMAQPVFLAFDPAFAHAWVTDAGRNVVNVYAYPAGTLVNTLSQFDPSGTVDGIALSN